MFILSCLDDPSLNCFVIAAATGLAACCSNPSMPPKPPVSIQLPVSILLAIITFFLGIAIADNSEELKGYSTIIGILSSYVFTRNFSTPLSNKINSIRENKS